MSIASQEAMNLAKRLVLVVSVPSLIHCVSGTVGAELSEELEVLAQGDADWSGDAEAADAAAGDSVTFGDEQCVPSQPVAVVPGANAIDVEITDAVQVIFSEPIAPESVTVDSFFLDGGVAGALMVDGDSVTLQPGSPLASGTTYSVTVTEAVTNLAGCPLVGDLRWSFTTEPQPIEPSLILNIMFRQDVEGASGIWFSSQGDANDLPELSVVFHDGEGQGIRNYRGGPEGAFAFYIRQAGFEDGGCLARGTNGSGRQCHQGELLIKESARRRALFRVDLSDIPVSAVIDSCSLTLHLHEAEGLAYGDHSSVVGVYQVVTDWDWDTATWTVPWDSGGGDLGNRILVIRAHEDMHNSGWNKAHPTGSIDLTDHLRALQAAR